MMGEAYDDAYEVGRSHGWGAANFADAYGWSVNRQRPLWVKTEDQISGYDTGFRDGCDEFADSMLEDHTEGE